MKPPRDPFLRAIWLVRDTDLSPREQLALLALWRYLGGQEKKIGAALLADLMRVSVGTAKNLFSALQRTGYLASDGTFARRFHRRATRNLTNKAKLPRLRAKGANSRQKKSLDRDFSAAQKKSRSDDSRRSRNRDIEVQVRLAGRLTPLQGDALLEQKTPPAAGPISDIPENEIGEINLGEVMASAPSAKEKAVGQL